MGTHKSNMHTRFLSLAAVLMVGTISAAPQPSSWVKAVNTSNGCGDACSSSADCSSGLCGSCELGYCVAGAKAVNTSNVNTSNGCGDACSSSADCSSGLCGSCELGYCVAGAKAVNPSN